MKKGTNMSSSSQSSFKKYMKECNEWKTCDGWGDKSSCNLIDCSCNLGDKHLLFYAMIQSLKPS
jgi:hypothetical protein